ncbi:unnamed protein product [Auanema sp. JU1783]|nr:unnamed protein product [Auanema sp. JU1783]
MKEPGEGDVVDDITFFARLKDDEANEESNSSGVLSSLFGRLWRSDGSSSAEGATPTAAAASSTEQRIDADTSNKTEVEEGAETSSSTKGVQPDEISIGSQDSDKVRRMIPSKLTSIFKGNKNKPRQNLVDYNRSMFKQYWMPDSTGKECYQCEERFNTLRRRHHCRLCGQIFCSKCCNIHVPGATLGLTGDLRLCDYCAKIMAQYLPPEADVRQGSEEMTAPSLPVLANNFPVEEAMLEQTITSSVISTVSAGNLMWSKPPEMKSASSPETENSLSFPPKPSKESLTLLSVQDLYAQHEGRLNKSRSNLTSTSLCEEEESGPDWFRNMDSGQSSSSNLIKSDNNSEQKVDISRISTMDFDAISPLDLSDCKNNKDPIDRKISNPLSGRNTRAFDGNIDRAFDERAEKMLDYLFKRECISDERWKPILLTLARRISHTLRIDVDRAKDSMNILSYVHVKKLHVDQPEPSAEMLWGVVCAKSVIHSSMSSELQNASVMIVAGSIEYERIQDKLSSIEPIICQEAEFLSKQVDRILSRKPSILLVEGVISRIAAQLLHKAGVVVIINVKKNVLLRVARTTGADILPSSDAQLIQQNIGFCPVFTQRIVNLKDGGQKILLNFNDCPPERGCSVLLKGGDMRELRAVKRVLHFMISLIYSSKLEKSFLTLFGCRIAGDEECNCDVCLTRAENIENNTDQSSFETALSESILSLSPFIRYEPPFLETMRGRKCTLLPYFKQPLYRFGVAEDFLEIAKEEAEDVQNKELAEKTCPPPEYPRHKFAKQDLTKPESNMIDNVAAFRALGGRVFRKRIHDVPEKVVVNGRRSSMDRLRFNNVLCPLVHQRVAVLFGSFSPKSPNAPSFCVRPWVLSIEFYGNHDMTLGEFLTKYCFNKSYECPSTNCEVPMLDHSRKLVYGRICLEVSTQFVVQNGTDQASVSNNGQVLCWNYCAICKASSPLQAMTPSVWHLSFGKYLDYLANSSFSKGSISSPSQNQCNHCFFHQHTHFFSQQNFVTTFKVTPIRPFDVQFSPVICRIVPQQFSRQALIDGVTRMAALAEDIVKVAEERLQVFVKHEHYNQYGVTYHTVLRQQIENTSQIIGKHNVYAQTLYQLDRQVIPSNDMYAVKANETMMYIREGIYNLITTWNDQCNVFAASMRALKKDENPNEGTEIALEKIDNPFPAYLHLSLKLQPSVGVVVRDIQDSRGVYKPDIGSIIAYALSSSNYEEGRLRARSNAGAEDIPINLNSSSLPQSEASLNAEHLEIEFEDNSTAYYVKAYFAERFRLLRKLLVAEGEEAFIRSLSQTTFWTPQGGKSGSFFYRTQDNRFIVKQMSRFEIQSFVKFAPNYFEYIKTAVTEHKLTTLCKVHGVFRVGVKSKTTQLKVDILVMEYLFYKHNVDRVWDLKGSLRNRLATTGGNNSTDVLLDENLMSDLWNNQLYVYPHSKAALNQAISNDSHFLSAQHVMDYSLLVGVDETDGKLILGIVDYMRTYTLDKKLESWVKIVAIPGAHLPTILSPELYCTRFSEAIDTYFPVVPDQWTGLGSAVSY